MSGGVTGDEAPAEPEPVARGPGKASATILAGSRLLRVGVLASLVVVVAGMVLIFIQHPAYVSSSSDLEVLTDPRTPFPHTVPAVLEDLRRGRGEAVVMLGLFLLIATPVARVASLLLAFVQERDWSFIAITSVVLALLLVSFVLGRAGG